MTTVGSNQDGYAYANEIVATKEVCHLQSQHVFRHLQVVGVGKSDQASYVDFVEVRIGTKIVGNCNEAVVQAKPETAICFEG